MALRERGMDQMFQNEVQGVQELTPKSIRTVPIAHTSWASVSLGTAHKVVEPKAKQAESFEEPPQYNQLRA